MRRFLRLFAATLPSVAVLTLVAKTTFDLDSFISVFVIVFFLDIVWPSLSAGRRDGRAEEAQDAPRRQAPLYEAEVRVRVVQSSRSVESRPPERPPR